MDVYLPISPLRDLNYSQFKTCHDLKQRWNNFYNYD